MPGRAHTTRGRPAVEFPTVPGEPGPLQVDTRMNQHAITPVAMPYYECPTCGGGYVIDPAPKEPTCD